MFTIFQVLNARHERKEKYNQSLLNYKTGIIAGILLSLLSTIVCIICFISFTELTHNLPSTEQLPQIIEPPGGLLYHPTQLYDRTGTHLIFTLENPASIKRQYLSIDKNRINHIPQWVVDATILIKDPYFWSHPGFQRFYPFTNENKTIAETIVTNYLFWDEPVNWKKDLQTKILAAHITYRYGRVRLLEWYLNSLNFGKLAYGVDSAAYTYFGKSGNELSLAESAMLVGISEIPVINPIDSPQVARQRMDEILDRLLKDKEITVEQAETVNNEVVKVQDQGQWSENIAPIFTQNALKQIAEKIGWDRLERGGIKIFTTLDYEKQIQSSCITRSYLSYIQGFGDTNKTSSNLPCENTKFLNNLSIQPNPSLPPLGAEVVILDHHTGQVLAYVSEDSDLPGSNSSDKRQAGTILTPFIYLSAFTQGYGPASLVWDIPEQSIIEQIPNFDNKYHGPIRLREALANDILVPAVHLYNQLGKDAILHTFNQLGLDRSSIDQTIFWEGQSFNLLEITRAFGSIANNGVLSGLNIKPENSLIKEDTISNLNSFYISKAIDLNGKLIIDWSLPDTKPVLSPQLAYLLTNILSDDVARKQTVGYPDPINIDRVAAAKIGRTVNNQDLWTIGFTSDFTTGIWMGTNSLRNTKDIQFLSSAVLWNKIMRSVNRDIPQKTWQIPDGISQKEVCDPSGLLPTKYCPNIVNEFFLSDSVPSQYDTLYLPVQIDRETKFLATVFTPLSIIDESVFLNIPLKANFWAKNSSIDIFPNVFDVINFNKDSISDAVIKNPGLGEYIHGKVDIMGKAYGDKFSYYTFQMGQGLYPKEWFQIGEKYFIPTKEGTLGVWDTKGLNGIYVLQLLLIHNNRKIDMATTQVTVDNLSPTIQDFFPSDRQTVQTSDNPKITLHATIQDNLKIKSVDFFINGKLIKSFSQSPYTIEWKTTEGKYLFKIRAKDEAGNETISETKFIVDS